MGSQPHTQRTGRHGEALALRHLLRRGYEILATNWRCAQGELDIVARESGTLVFIEVRTRRQPQTDEAFASITARKRERLIASAWEWLQAHGFEEARWRFDVIAIALGPRTRIAHREDALDW